MKDPSPTVRGRATRAALLDAAAGSLAERGFERTTTTVVAAAAGVSTGTFYAHFADKHAILAALFADALDALVGAQEAGLTADRLLDDGLEVTIAGVVDAVVGGFRAHGPVLRAALARVPVDAVLRRVYWERHAAAVAAAAQFVRRAVAAGAVPPGDDAARAAALVVVLQGLNHPVALADDPSGAAVRGACVAGVLGVLR
jgi:AcrR family transcriptional regulator